MLPSDISEGSDGGLHPQTETTAQSIDAPATGTSFVFDLPDPKNLSTVSYANETYIGSNLPSNRSHTPIYSSDVLPSFPKKNLSAVSYANETYIGSNLPSNRSHTPVYSSDDLSSVPQKNLSTVSYANETYIGSDLLSNRSHTPVYSSDFLPSDPCIEDFAADEVGPSWKLSMPEEDTQSLFSNIYSTSGPHFSAPRPVHFDSLEDSMNSDHLQPRYEIDYDTIDFHWKPFDRKNLVVSVSGRLQKPIYASRPVRSNGASDASECEHSVKPVNTETNTLNSYIFPGPASPLLSISPTPFRFLVPPESDASSSVQDQNAVQKPSTPKKAPYFELPGIYISPLDEHRTVHDTVSNLA